MLRQKERNAKALTELPKHTLRAEQKEALRAANERLRKAAQRNPVKQIEYTNARIETLQAKLPGLYENIARRERQVAKARKNLDLDRLKAAETEALISQLRLRLDDGHERSSASVDSE
jgi:hypothetical protein